MVTLNTNPEDLFGELVEKTKYLGDVKGKLLEAYQTASKYHAGQKRESGEDYIAHPLSVANILAELETDLPTLQAAILHDTLEDTPLKEEELKEKFGLEVLSLVQGVTKLSKVQFRSSKEQQLENTRKMLLAMASDIRVVLIKLADRLHNMRSVEVFRKDKQKRIATDTMEIFVPLASRLGIYRVKWELEDLSFRYLEPEIYYDLSKQVALKRSEREKLVQQVMEELSECLNENDIKCDISGRAKNLYSIYKKMEIEDKGLDEVFDLHAVRVLVDDIPTCYKVLGIVHSKWKPLPGRIKDYIAVPKSNGYQSLHTTVMGPWGNPVEIQIRTYQMHDDAEYGIAAHWRYKEGKIQFSPDYNQKLSWLRQLLEWQREIKPSDEFVERVKTDLFSDEVLVFTPKGDIINLPVGATPVDFAYRIHTNVGHSCIGAKVNGQIVQLSYKLQTGDRVQILTSKHINGPSRDWLKFVVAHSTKERIRSWFRKQTEEEQPKQKDEPESVKAPPKPRKLPKFGKGSPLISVKGVDNAPLVLARCCSPIYGDPIVGYITRGRGVSIHRVNCQNLAQLKKDSERVLEAEWIKSDAVRAYVVSISTTVDNKPGVLAKLSSVISEEGVNIQMAKATPLDSQRSRVMFAIEVTSTKELQDLISRLERVPEVKKVVRH
ncbi:MAG: bifunctional (p)ppGpp synthetase/guanosine-3',5'-bis(diphosphate) 3'-pyrophosphohydrolase [Caldisericales bacterium]|nr:bifunctional (p)ppGpp synthetase/guanosine-3',5'-bis(diphosphate) 3'-pyrophosphohydrolase [Caldisericales bacterium]